MDPANWKLALATSTKIKSGLTVTADLQHFLKAVQGGNKKNEALCSLGKTDRIGLQVDIFK